MKLSVATTLVLFILDVETYGKRFYLQLKLYSMVKRKGQFCFSVDTLLFYIFHSCHKSITKSATFLVQAVFC